MIKMFPKTNELLEGADKFSDVVKEYKGIEIQYFNKNGIMEYVSFENAINNICSLYDDIEEITVHPPLNNYEIELLLLKDENIIIKELNELACLSKELNIKINIIYHSLLSFDSMKEVLSDKIRKLLLLLKDTNVTILLENVFMTEENKMAALEFASYIDNPNLRVCFDICHAYCRAHIFKKDINEFLDKYLDKALCEKYVKQVHFSFARKNDGYIDHNTHGRCHDDANGISYDLELLDKYHMLNCIIVTEVDEDDNNYNDRCCQIKELDMINEYFKNSKVKN